MLFLNQDCVVDPDAIGRLWQHALENPGTICAAVTADLDAPHRVLWAGTRWGPAPGKPWLFLGTSTVPLGVSVEGLPSGFIACDMTGGRGVLFPRSTFEEIGLLDAVRLPQYGADNDFTLRARKAGYSIHVVTSAIVRTRTGDSVNRSGVRNSRQ